jgi:hypothetical protein
MHEERINHAQRKYTVDIDTDSKKILYYLVDGSAHAQENINPGYRQRSLLTVFRLHIFTLLRLPKKSLLRTRQQRTQPGEDKSAKPKKQWMPTNQSKPRNTTEMPDSRSQDRTSEKIHAK